METAARVRCPKSPELCRRRGDGTIWLSGPTDWRLAVKTFRVEIFAGHRVVPLLHGRLDVSEDALTVRAWPGWMLTPRTARRETVRCVQVKHRRAVKVITIDDAGGVFTKMNVNVLARGYSKLHALLRHLGYVVIDKD